MPPGFNSGSNFTSPVLLGKVLSCCFPEHHEVGEVNRKLVKEPSASLLHQEAGTGPAHPQFPVPG